MLKIVERVDLVIRSQVRDYRFEMHLLCKDQYLVFKDSIYSPKAKKEYLVLKLADTWCSGLVDAGLVKPRHP